MKIMYILLILIIIIISIIFVIINDYNKLSTINIKIKNSNEKINNLLKQKYDLLNKIVESTKKIKTKKDYLKEFKHANIDNITSYELDNLNDDTLDLLIKLIEDNKDINNKDNKKLLIEIKEINQKLNSSKKYFNKNNNELMKLMKGRIKILAKFTNIIVRNSYEIKEPTK